MKKFLERDENELTNIQCLWDTAKAVLRGTFIEIQAYLNKQTNKQTNKNKNKPETFQINNLTLHLQETQEQQQRQTRASRKKEITQIRTELNNIQTKSTILRINVSRSWFFEKIKLTSI